MIAFLVGWSVGLSVCQKNVKKEVLRLFWVVQVYKKIEIAYLGVHLYFTNHWKMQ